MANRQHVVITGASTGIGEACARFLAERDIHVVAGVRKQSDADRLLREVTTGLQTIFIDVTDSQSIATAAESVGKVVGDRGLAGLVNNAGVAVGGPLEFLPLERLRRQLEVNLMGHVAVTQALLPYVRRAKGRIINMGSISGRIASPLLGPYAISKFGLEAFSDCLRRELYPWGLHVSLIEPGAIATPIWEKGVREFEEMLSIMSSEARRLYEQDMKAGGEGALKMGREAIPARAVAEAVHHALTSPKPRSRYLVGKDAKLAGMLASALPDRVMDWILRKARQR